MTGKKLRSTALEQRAPHGSGFAMLAAIALPIYLMLTWAIRS